LLSLVDVRFGLQRLDVDLGIGVVAGFKDLGLSLCLTDLHFSWYSAFDHVSSDSQRTLLLDNRGRLRSCVVFGCALFEDLGGNLDEVLELGRLVLLLLTYDYAVKFL